jgi:hypothetical protein
MARVAERDSHHARRRLEQPPAPGVMILRAARPRKKRGVPSVIAGPHAGLSGLSRPPHRALIILRPRRQLFERGQRNYLRKCFLILRLSDQRRHPSKTTMNTPPATTIAIAANNKVSTKSVLPVLGIPHPKKPPVRPPGTNTGRPVYQLTATQRTTTTIRAPSI